MPQPLENEPPRWNEAYTVVFLIDQAPPQHIVTLKRASWKAFAPGLFTGIGGAIETGENALVAAHRELAEETGLTGLALHEFARCIIRQQQKVLHYYWAIYSSGLYPDRDQYPGPGLPVCTEGQLEWSAVDQLAEKPWIPTTAAVVQEWTQRNFALARPWTLYASPLAGDETWLHRRIEKIEEGLHFE